MIVCADWSGSFGVALCANLVGCVHSWLSLRFSRLQPPESPILGEFEPRALAQSPLLVGDLGGKDLSDDGSKDLRVHPTA